MIDPLSPLLRSSLTFRSDVNTFFATDLPAFVAQVNSTAQDVSDDATAAAASADAADDSADAAAADRVLAETARGQSQVAAAAAQAATGNPNSTGTSTSNVAIATGTKAFTIAEPGRAWTPGMLILAQNDSGHYMEGRVASYAHPTLTLDVVTAIGGPGSYASWNFSVRPAYPNGRPEEVAANRTLAVFGNYNVRSSLGPLTLGEPPSAVVGDSFSLADIDGVADLKPITINLATFNGQAGPVIVDTPFFSKLFELTASKGWVCK